MNAVKTTVPRATIVIVLGVANAWAVAALCIDVRPPWPGWLFAAGYILAAFSVFLKMKGWRRWASLAACPALVAAWWLCLQPSNDRDWQSDVAVLPYGEIVGNRVTLHNIRNCDYRTPEDYDVRHYERIFDLDRLRTVDLFMVYWGSPNIAHTMVSFGFDNGEHVCISIETRKERGESYSALKGFFRKYELTYVIADERDLVRLRTNYRAGEDVYLYRMRATSAQARRLFLDYIGRANQLKKTPEWYNAITSNCTTAIRTQRAATDRIPWDWRMLVNGHLDELFYEQGLIDTRLSFQEARRLALVNEKARAADHAEDFSRQIRLGEPTESP